MNRALEFLNRFPRRWAACLAAMGIFFVAFPAGFFTARHFSREALGKLSQFQKELVSTKNQYDKLRVDYTNLENDRNNILIQTKRYVQDSNRLSETVEKYENLSKVHRSLAKRSSRLERSYAKLLKRHKQFETALDKARQSLRRLVPQERKQKVTIEKLRQQLKERIEKSPVFQELKGRMEQTSSEKSQLGDQLSAKVREMADLERRFQEMGVYQSKYTEALREIGRLEGVKRGLEREQLNAPQRFKEVAQQNKILVKETAGMHYNLGIFYAESKRFELALEEFKKAAELNPANFEAHYNLGLLYAEHYEKHDLAETHFREYLQLAPEDPGGDWVRNYLVSRDVYGAQVRKS